MEKQFTEAGPVQAGAAAVAPLPEGLCAALPHESQPTCCALRNLYKSTCHLWFINLTSRHVVPLPCRPARAYAQLPLLLPGDAEGQASLRFLIQAAGLKHSSGAANSSSAASSCSVGGHEQLSGAEAAVLPCRWQLKRAHSSIVTLPCCVVLLCVVRQCS